jgi:nitroimidazol reductase NimA-like FMN-containing flavoprotein (pyridoxamine 5'-phosphate oxidase superfamily)
METLSRDEVDELLEQAPVAHIGVLFEGRPYVTPMSFVRLGGVFYFRTGPGRRLEAIRSDPATCLEVTKYEPSSGHWRSVVVTGEASLVTDPELEAAVSQEILRKYARAIGSPMSHPGLVPLNQDYIVAVRPLELTGWSSGSGLAPGLRPGRL